MECPKGFDYCSSDSCNGNVSGTLCSVISAWSGRSEIPRMQPNTAKSDRSGFSPPQIKSRCSIIKITYANEFPLSNVVVPSYHERVCCQLLQSMPWPKQILFGVHIWSSSLKLGTSTAVKRASRSFSMPYFFLILPCAAAIPPRISPTPTVQQVQHCWLKTQEKKWLANLVHPQLEWPQHVAAKIRGIFANIPMPLSTQTENHGGFSNRIRVQNGLI